MAAVNNALNGCPVPPNIPYPNPGTIPPTVSFTATATGPITAYFYASEAGLDSRIGLRVNGVSTGIFGLPNHASSYGDSIVLGTVNAGDALEFELQVVGDGYYGRSTGIFGLPNHASNHGDGIVLSTANVGDALGFELQVEGAESWFSDPADNADGGNHTYATNFDGDAHIPAGTYVAFEDLAIGGSDLDYNDYQFVFTNGTVVKEQQR